MEMRLAILIMAGGSGERFWPLSTKERPKQLLKIVDRERSLLQMTVERVAEMVPLSNIFVATNSIQAAPIMEQLPQLPKENLIIEPAFRDTAAAIGYGTFIIDKIIPNSTIAVLASDHLIADEEQFREVVKVAAERASKGHSIITLGIEPTHPETGYGYIEVDPNLVRERGEIVPLPVKKFHEKPSLEVAKRYLDEGNYLWNSGIFIYNSKLMMELIELHLPNHHQNLMAISKLGERIRDHNDGELIKLFNKFERISIDFGVMEKIKEIEVYPSTFGWNDVGSYPALTEIMELNSNETLSIGGELKEVNSKNNIVICHPNESIYLLGVEGMVVVKSGDTILICKREEAQNIKKIIPKE